MVLDPIPQSLPVHFFGSRPQPPTSHSQEQIGTRWRKPIGCLIFGGHFLQKSTMIDGSFAERDLQLEASYRSSSPCSYHSDMGWLRLVGSLKLYVSLPEYSLFYRALLQKRLLILSSLLIIATPYQFKRALLVGSLKVYVSFVEYSLSYGSLLQKRLIILRSLLNVTTPYQSKRVLIVGSLKSYVSLAEYSLLYRALLQKRLIILRSLLVVNNLT